ILGQDGIQFGIFPSAVAPELAPGDAFVAIPALLVDPLHRRVHGVALDPMQPELVEGEPGPDADRIRSVTAAPGRPLADEQAAGGPAMLPIDLVEPDEADVLLG